LKKRRHSVSFGIYFLSVCSMFSAKLFKWLSAACKKNIFEFVKICRLIMVE
jgi:hypothetical protein